MLRPGGWPGAAHAGGADPDLGGGPLLEEQGVLSKRSAAFEGAFLLSSAAGCAPEALPPIQPSNSENLTSCMADLVLAPCDLPAAQPAPDHRDASQPKLELIHIPDGACAAPMQPCTDPHPPTFIDFEMGAANMFYADQDPHAGVLFGEDELREPDFDGAVPSLLSADAWPGSARCHDLASSAPDRTSPLLFSKPSEQAFGGAERVIVPREPLEWVSSEIGGRGMAMYGGSVGVTSGGGLFPLEGPNVENDEEPAPSSSLEEAAFAWVPSAGLDAARRLPSESTSSIVAVESEMQFLDDCDGMMEEGGEGFEGGAKAEEGFSNGPISPGRANGRGCRRRVHPVGKFAGEEVCWTPDDTEGSDGGCGRERARRSRAPGRAGARPGRPRPRGFGRRNSWASGASGALEAINKRRKQHNPWSLEETKTLVKGVEICGGGKWADIKRLGFQEIGSRSPVDLKDKWRNLLRVALLPLEQIKLKKVDNRHNLPMELLNRVKELAQDKDKSPRTAQMQSGKL
ncbi:unnamed protein product [Ostreobium quekettii]|uniref:Uncharacterized protein n=1 Tax=Ostreobium quekettii TaxID=121088 RepID=A0A8S1J2V7_9CHLO|nr:unnamed protein product [Ostreobium quekettii]